MTQTEIWKRELKDILSKDALREQMPKVGDVRWESPTVDTLPGHNIAKKPQRCVVVEVRPEHFWYTVQFENGVKESYKLPRVRSGSQ